MDFGASPDMVAEDPAEAALTALNASLQQMGQPYKLALVDPASLKELDKNAHFMTHEMFQNLGSGQSAFLGHMPDKDDRKSLGFGHVEQLARAFPNLAYRAGGGAQLRQVRSSQRRDR